MFGKLISVLFGVIVLSSFSLALEPSLCVNAIVSDISPSSVGVDESFTVGIQIENCGATLPEAVTFEIVSLPEDINVKESLRTEIPRLLYSNSERFLVYHMETTKEALPGSHIIKTRLTYGNAEQQIVEDDQIQVDVIGDEAELNIASVKTKPVLPKKSDTVELTIRIENFGEGTANSVRVEADHSFQGIKEIFIGTLGSDEESPAIFTLIADEAGEFDFPVTVFYQDDFGEHSIKTPIQVIILKRDINYFGIIGTVILLALIGVLIYYFYKTRREKNKIIRQLLRGDELKEMKHSMRTPRKRKKK